MMSLKELENLWLLENFKTTYLSYKKLLIIGMKFKILQMEDHRLILLEKKDS